MSGRMEFGSRAAANRARDAFDIDDDRRYKAVDLGGAEIEEPDLDRLYGMAAESRLDHAGRAGQAALTEAEKEKIDFSKVDVFSASAAKATLQEQGVEDWMSMLDQSLELDEVKGLAGPEAQRQLRRQLREMGRAAAVGRTAARDPEGHRERGLHDPTDESVAHAYQRQEAGLEKHAVEGARRGHAEAKAELRRMGWSDPEIQEIVATGQVQAALTPGQTVRLSNGMKVTPRTWAKAALTPGQTVRLSNGMKVTPRTWAKAKRSHEHRRVRSQYVDESRKAPLTTDYEKWRKNPDRYDYPGVDTRRPLPSFFKTEEQYRRFHGVADDLWKWQRGTGGNRL